MLVNKRWMTTLGALLTLGLLGTTPAQAAEPIHVGATLEGCNVDTPTTFPINGRFVCPDDGDYTSGNLGKYWNELDNVPYRITLDAKTPAPASQTYTFAVVLDRMDGGHPGFDKISAPILNTSLSDQSCQEATSSNATETPLEQVQNGTDQSIYRLITVTQLQNTTCVYDYYGRLAIGSHLFSGASLHANLWTEALNTSGIGAKEVSIPVNEISPQKISKTMTAQQGADLTWSIAKNTDSKLDFGDVCSSEEPISRDVAITVTWKKLETIAGKTSGIIVLSAENPSSRTIAVTFHDTLYKGTVADTTKILAEYTEGPFPLLPGHNGAVTSIPFEFAAGEAGNIGDALYNVVTGDYTDVVYPDESVPGQLQNDWGTTIQQGAITNASTTINDVEDINDDKGLMYSVGAPSFGNFLNGYVEDTPTSGAVSWQTTDQKDGGEITFNKKVYLDVKRVMTGEFELSDIATLTGSDGFSADYKLAIPITSVAKPKLTIKKTIPDDLLDETGEKLIVKFQITRSGDGNYLESVEIPFVAGGATTKSVDLEKLVPDNYTVQELSSTFFKKDSDSGVVITMVDPRSSEDFPNPRPVDLTINEDNIATCSALADFENEPGKGKATVQVQKITAPVIDDTADPDYLWEFKLYGPDGLLSTLSAVGANAGPSKFLDGTGKPLELAEGAYTVVETTKPGGWDLISAEPDTDEDKVCDFKVDYPLDLGVPFSCSFTNRELPGHAKVIKTMNGLPDLGGNLFTFALRSGATPLANGQPIETLDTNAGNGGILAFVTPLVPNQTYQICEIVRPGWLNDFATFVPGSFMPPDGIASNPDVDNSIICGDFSVGRGETKEITINNDQPPTRGSARTIGYWRNWASCSKSNGKQADVLGQTLDLFANDGVLIGDLFVSKDHCLDAVRILSKQDIGTGKQKSSDPAFNMAAQLLAAKLNVQAGATACPAALTAIAAGQALLDQINFNGTGDYLKKGGTLATQANNLATTLDQYNNNTLCTGP